MVLKDGQIIEQGSHKELVAHDGVFASMWADQVSATDDLSPSIEDSVKGEVSGYVIDELNQPPADDHEPSTAAATAESSGASPSVHVPDAPEDTPAPTNADANGKLLVDLTETSPVTFPSSEPEDRDIPPAEPATSDHPSEAPAISSPPFVEEPLSFPASDDTSAQPTPDRVATPIPAVVTFGASVNSPPSRTGTPDPDSEPKRKRISSQNFQRLARRMSLTTRKQSSSSIIPGLKRDSPRVSTDEGSARGEGSMHESPAGSIKGDADKSKLKKDKKEKKDKSRKGSL